MWRWTEIDVTLSPLLTAPRNKECLMTFIAVRCPHCQSEQIVKRGKTGCGTQRYLCQHTTCATGSFPHSTQFSGNALGRCFKAVDLVSSVEDECHQFCGGDHDYPSAALSILSRNRYR